MEEKQFSQFQTEKIGCKETILANQSFKRFANGFKLYQSLLHGEDSEPDQSLVVKRMQELYKTRLDTGNNTNEIQDDKSLEALIKIIDSTLKECEEDDFTVDDLADKITNSPVYDLLMSEWNHSADEIEECSEVNFVNEIYGYKVEDDNEVSLHIRPSNIKSDVIGEKRMEGRRLIAEKLKSGKIKANKITMKSWLFSKEREEDVRSIFGENVLIEDVLLDNDKMDGIQFLAMQYNQRALEKYLKTGAKPEVRQITMSKDEFIQRFN